MPFILVSPLFSFFFTLFVHSQTIQGRWGKSQPLFSSLWLILASSVFLFFSPTISLPKSVGTVYTQSLKHFASTSHIFFRFTQNHIQSALHAFLIVCLGAYGVIHIWIWVVRKYPEKCISALQEHVKNVAFKPLWWIDCFVYSYIYI